MKNVVHVFDSAWLGPLQLWLLIAILFLLPTAVQAEFLEYPEYYYFYGAGVFQGSMEKPWDVDVDKETGEVYVLDLRSPVSGRGRVVVFAPYPNYGYRRIIAQDFFPFPWAVAVHRERVYVSGEGNPLYGNGIAVFHSDGTLIDFIRFGTPWAIPRDLAIDARGAVYVVEHVPSGDVLHKFDATGKLIVTITGPSSEEKFGRLRSVAAHPKQSFVYLTDEDKKAVYLVSFSDPFYHINKWDILLDWHFPDYCRPKHVGIDGAGVAYIGVCDRWIVRIDEMGKKLFHVNNNNDGSIGGAIGSLPAGIDFLKSPFQRVSLEDFRTVDLNRRIFTVNEFQQQVFIFAPTDSDGDGLLDEWETRGFDYDNDGIVDVDLPAMGADPQHKDLFLELDWVSPVVEDSDTPTPGSCSDGVDNGGDTLVDENDDDCQVSPTREAIQNMKAAFAAAPVDAGKVLNPDGKPGINLWVDTGSLFDPDATEDPLTANPGSCSDGIDNGGDGQIDGQDTDCLVGDNLGGGNEITTDTDRDGSPGPIRCFQQDRSFYSTKKLNSEEARRVVFHYGIKASYADRFCTFSGNTEEYGGLAESIGGANFIVWNRDRFLRFADRDGATIMHELGHTVGLWHGGDENQNCKPNYVSIMNYRSGFGVQQFRDNLREDGTLSGSCDDGIDNGSDGRTDRDEPECRRFILDFSPPRFPRGRGRAPYPTLREDQLEEITVLDPSDAFNYFAFIAQTGRLVTQPVNRPPNWNADIDPPYEEANLPQINIDTCLSNAGTCVPVACDNSKSDSKLTGWDDWSNITLNHRLYPDHQTIGASPPESPDPTDEQLETIRNVIAGCDRGDIDCDGDVDRDDLNQLIAKLNTRSFGSADPHDLNGDGMITTLDARQLEMICTRPGCARFPGPIATLCSILGNDPKPSLLDQDIFELEGQQGDAVKVILEKDPLGMHSGDRATLVLKEKRHYGASFFKIDGGNLPNELTATLPQTGTYHVIVSEQPKFVRGKRFRGNYCVKLESSVSTAQTFTPTKWVEE